MLADYKRVKGEFGQLLDQRLHQSISRAAPFVAEIPSKIYHEGSESALIDFSGDYRKLDPTKIKSGIEIQWSEVRDLTLADVLGLIDKAAEELASQQSKHVFEVMNEVTARTGNVVDNLGKPLDPDGLLNALDCIPIDFDENEAPRFPSLVIHPKMEARVREVLEAFDTDPHYRRKMSEFLARKKADWRAREADRSLVD